MTSIDEQGLFVFLTVRNRRISLPSCKPRMIASAAIARMHGAGERQGAVGGAPEGGPWREWAANCFRSVMSGSSGSTRPGTPGEAIQRRAVLWTPGLRLSATLPFAFDTATRIAVQ